ncbi:MAG: methyltransferase domain-containing protein [Planctomycetes bacterium]|nr:methyltransferase domain-containing protein [Planctomycetota bacterium]MCB9889239.1 methyltransferase domain-containing protein [Planctomycetota bacterium]
MTVPEALRDPALRRFRLRRHRLHCAGGELSVVAPARGDDLLEGPRAAACLRSGQMPYWADIWPASVGMARALMRGPERAGCRALDLGCGIGVAGLAAGRRGAMVHFADLSPDALQFARFNSRGLPARVTFQQLDWSRETVDGSFDLLLLADVAYEERNSEPLARHLDRCLAPRGVGLLTDPYRAATDAFLDRLQGGDFTLDETRLDTAFGGQRFALRLVEIRRRTS